MAQRSNFRRQPEQRTFAGDCPIHGAVDRSEVEQFDGSMVVRPCKQCQWSGLRVSPVGSDEHTRALAQVAAERLNSALVGSGITPRFADCAFSTYRATFQKRKSPARGLGLDHSSAQPPNERDGELSEEWRRDHARTEKIWQ